MNAANYSISLAQLQERVASQQGYSLIPSQWSPNQAAAIKDIVDSGVARVYFPPPIDGKEIAVEWSFLRPEATLDLPQGSQQITMPEDFGYFVGDLCLATKPQVTSPWRIEWRNEGQIRHMYQITPGFIGPPRYACQIPLKGTGATEGQQYALLLYPIADQEYTITCVYSVAPEKLSGAFPYAYGGPQHRELYIESCLAVAEQRFDDMEGVHTAMFKQLLMAAISIDNRSKPQILGYNGNRNQRWYNKHLFAGAATYMGNSFN